MLPGILSVGGADGGHRDGGVVVHPASCRWVDSGHLVRVLADGGDPVGADTAVGQLLPVAAQGLALGEGRDADGCGQGDGVLGLVEGGACGRILAGDLGVVVARAVDRDLDPLAQGALGFS